MYDVFISYTEQDGAWAGLLADRLAADGVRVFFDRFSLHPGDVVVHEVEAAIRASGHGILVIGPDTASAPWARQEYAALVHAATEGRLRLIPVVFGDADLPPFAETRVWMDFRKLTGPAFDAKAAELARVLRGEDVSAGADAFGPVRPPRPPRPPDESVPASFVVCHARADAGYAELLADHLSRSGLPMWSLGDLKWGDDYLWTIRQRLRRALAVVVLMSPEAEESEDVTREILEGQRHSREFFPVLLRGERNYLLASSWYFDARSGALPGPDELRLLRRLSEAHRPDRAPGESPLLPPPPARSSVPASTFATPSPGPARTSLGRLETLLAEGETEHADLLTTTLLLEAVGRLEDGWLRRSDGRRLPDDLLAGIDERWSRFSGGRYGFGAQTRHSPLKGGRRADFTALCLGYGWRASLQEVVPKYQHFIERSGGPGFFPTLRNPQSEQYLDWYDQWTETVLSVHLRLRERGWPQ